MHSLRQVVMGPDDNDQGVGVQIRLDRYQHLFQLDPVRATKLLVDWVRRASHFPCPIIKQPRRSLIVFVQRRHIDPYPRDLSSGILYSCRKNWMSIQPMSCATTWLGILHVEDATYVSVKSFPPQTKTINRVKRLLSSCLKSRPRGEDRHAVP